MNKLNEQPAHCPYCDGQLVLLIDPSVGSQRYTEDCHICCQPIEVTVVMDLEGDISVSVQPENA